MRKTFTFFCILFLIIKKIYNFFKFEKTLGAIFYFIIQIKCIIFFYIYRIFFYNKYDNLNNDWLSHKKIEGEWCVAYSWITYSKEGSNLNEKYENDNDIRNKGHKVGKGIYCSQTPDNMENYIQAIEINGQKYKLGLMLRVIPKKIRSPESKDELWVVNGNPDEIRPYGILIKKL